MNTRMEVGAGSSRRSQMRSDFICYVSFGRHYQPLTLAWCEGREWFCLELEMP